MNAFKAVVLLSIPVYFFVFTGCVSTVDLDPRGEIVFNQRLRADTGATEGMETPLYYSDGGSRSDGIISELYHSTINGQILGKLKKSSCFWAEGDGFAKLSFEPILKNSHIYHDGDFLCAVEAMGTCGASMSEPESRKAIMCDGTNCVIPPEGLPFTIGWRACTEGGTPREMDYNARAALNSNCTTYDAANLSAEFGNPHPYCMVRASLPSMLTDTSIELQPLTDSLKPLNETFKNLKAEPHKVLPHMKVVMGSRALARPLAYAYDLLHQPDDHPDSDRYYWQWQVPIEGDLWREDFSPYLKVNTLRVFVERGTDKEAGIPSREYLTVRNVHAGGTRCRGEENPEIGGTEFHLIECAMDVTLDILAFSREDGQQDAKRYYRRFLIDNPGGLDLHRRGMTITGSHASFFTILTSRYNATDDSPPPASRWISPGLDETFTVLYHPTSPGMHNTQIEIDSDAGQEAIDLHDVCYGSCSYSPQ